MITKRPRSVGPSAAQAARARPVVGSQDRGEVVALPRLGVSEMQRARLLGAAVAVVDELGYARATVAHITARARVSRRTFYDLFDSREACLLAVIDDTVETLAVELAGAGLAGLAWRERMRLGLWTVLCFFDREPVLARVVLVHSVNAGQRVLERREEVFASLARAIDGGRRDSRGRGGELPVLIAEGLVGAGVAIVHKRLLLGDVRPLGELLAPLMGMIVLPYLGSAVAARERGRRAPELPVGVAGGVLAGGDVWSLDPLCEAPMRLTYRTARVLEVVATYPGASNRVVGEGAGIFDQGQVSKLLSRLERLGLLANTGEGQSRGLSNAWRLTRKGAQITRHLSLDPARGEEGEG